MNLINIHLKKSEDFSKPIQIKQSIFIPTYENNQKYFLQ